MKKKKVSRVSSLLEGRDVTEAAASRSFTIHIPGGHSVLLQLAAAQQSAASFLSFILSSVCRVVCVCVCIFYI